MKRFSKRKTKKEIKLSIFLLEIWSLLPPFPCFIGAYLTLEQTEEELDPNHSQVLRCSCSFVVVVVWFCSFFCFATFIALLIILFSIAFCHHFGF